MSASCIGCCCACLVAYILSCCPSGNHALVLRFTGQSLPMNLFRLIQKHGFTHLVEQVFNRIVPSWVMRFAVMNIYEVDREKICQLERDERIVCQLADDESSRQDLRDVTFMSLAEERVAAHLGYSAANLDSDVVDGSTGASKPNSLIGGVWAGRGAYLEEDFGFVLNLSDNQAWIYCALVKKSARGGGVYTNVFCHAINDLASRGHDEVLLSVTPWNNKSQRAHKKLVGDRIGRIYAIRILSFACVLTSGDMAKSNTVTFDPASKPIAISLKPAKV